MLAGRQCFCAYFVPTKEQPFSGTKWAGVPFGADRANILPHQLTGYNEDQTNPRNWINRPMQMEWRYVETKNAFDAYKGKPGDDTHSEIPESQEHKDGQEPWRPGPVFDGLTLNPDSNVVYFPVARDSGITYVIQIQSVMKTTIRYRSIMKTSSRATSV